MLSIDPTADEALPNVGRLCRDLAEAIAKADQASEERGAFEERIVVLRTRERYCVQRMYDLKAELARALSLEGTP